jgi:hypothetical protein
MTKFSKRMKKANRKARNVLVVGTALGNLEDLLEAFNTVFVVNGTLPRIQKRNVVYRENFDNIHLVSDVDLIIIDFLHEKFIPELQQIWRRTQPIIIIEGPELISKECQKLLKSDHYAIREVAKNYHVWKK